MASAPPSQPQPQGPPPLLDAPPASASSISWEGDKMFNIYILDYCNKRGYSKTARELMAEADIQPGSAPPIDARQGLLFEWWSVFWVLFQAKNNHNGSTSADAMTYIAAKHVRTANGPNAAPPGPGPALRPGFPPANGMPPRQGPLPPASAPGAAPAPQPMPNGIAHPGPPGVPQQPPSYGAMGALPPPQPNGPPPHPTGFPPNAAQPRPPGPPGPGQQPPRTLNGAFQSPTMAPSPQGQSGPSPHMAGMRPGMPPPASGHPTPTVPFQTISGPSPGRQDAATPSAVPQPSPSFAARVPSDRLMHELHSIPPEVLRIARAEAALGEKDVHSMSESERVRLSFSPLHPHALPTALTHCHIQQRVLALARRRLNPASSMVNGMQPPPPNAIAGPSGMQPPSAPPTRASAKRSSTSPGTEHETIPRGQSSPHANKRARRTPDSQQPQQQQQQQQQPPPHPPHAGQPQMPPHPHAQQLPSHTQPPQQPMQPMPGPSTPAMAFPQQRPGVGPMGMRPPGMGSFVPPGGMGQPSMMAGPMMGAPQPSMSAPPSAMIPQTHAQYHSQMANVHQASRQQQMIPGMPSGPQQQQPGTPGQPSLNSLVQNGRMPTGPPPQQQQQQQQQAPPSQQPKPMGAMQPPSKDDKQPDGGEARPEAGVFDFGQFHMMDGMDFSMDSMDGFAPFGGDGMDMSWMNGDGLAAMDALK
ncbi:hypothetical protein K488DRAFT_88213 [Vararia minispora EC-137]|uniref:Uncharacterized protein n=1 Tax=Vararia minispora EC-137 TaxID=1314806 RepID=A0ACB8QDQ5_9AGAM|nr:hypothetical protein K488DRAFT_88213 [Vararia minispora EC-137]